MPGPLHRLLSVVLPLRQPLSRPIPAGAADSAGLTPGTTGHDPSRLAARAGAVAGTLPPLLAEALRLADTVASGLHGRHRTGAGDDFWQFRPYDRGDPATLIDWRQSARRQHAYVRQREWTVAQTVTVWCANHDGLRWRSSPAVPEKLEQARLLTVALAALLLRGEERVTVLMPDPASQTSSSLSGLPAPASLSGSPAPASFSLGRGALHQIAARLCADAPRADLPPPCRLPRHSTAVLVSDFLMPPADLEPVLRRMAAADIRGYLVQVLDPAEETFPFDGRIRFRLPAGAEDGQDWLVPRCEDLRDAYRDRLMQHRKAVMAVCRSTGWQVISHRTDQPLAVTLLGLQQAMTARPVGRGGRG